MLLRPNLISIWIIYDLFIFIKLIKNKNVKQLLNIILYNIIGIIAVSLPIIIYLFINNAFIDFINNYLLFNFKYSDIKESPILKTLYFFIKQTQGILIYILIVNLMLIFKTKSKSKEKSEFQLLLLNIAYYLFTFVLVIIPQRNYTHYAIVMLPTIIIPTSLLLKYLKTNKYINSIFVMLIIFYLIFTVKCYDEFWNNEYTNYIKDVSLYVKNNTNENDNVLQIGNETNIYVLANRQYKGKYFYQLPVALYSEEIVNEFLEELKSDLPKAIIDVRGSNYTKINNIFNKEINEILNKNYNTENNIVYLKKGEV